MEERVEPTPEDIERVAEALKERYDARLPTEWVHESSRLNIAREAARAALSAYLEGKA